MSKLCGRFHHPAIFVALVLASSFVQPVLASSFDETRGRLPARFYEGAIGTRLVITASIRASLEHPPLTIELSPGKLSDPVELGEKGVFRVSVTPTEWSDAFDRQTYALVLTDESGNEQARMNIGSSTTATFESLGVQVYMLALEQPVL